MIALTEGGYMRNFGIIMMSHGEYAKATLGSLEMIAGHQDGVIALELDVNKSSDQFKAELVESIASLRKDYEHLLVLCDLYGGTPFNTVLTSLMEGENYVAFSGFNLPVALATSLSGELDQEGIKSLVKTTLIDSIFDLTELSTQDQETNDGDL